MLAHRITRRAARHHRRFLGLLTALALLLTIAAPAGATPAAPAAANAPHWENFLAAPAGWTLSSGLSVAGGALVSQGDDAYLGRYDGSSYSGAFVYRVDARNSYTGNGNTARIIFNYESDERFYSLSLGGAGEVKLTKGFWTDLATSPKSFSPAAAATYEIRYDQGAITVKAYRDNTVTVLFDRFRDPSDPIAAGKVGLGSTWALAEFDNLEVTLGAYRDPLHHPFAQSSIWNTPVGAGAVYVPAGITPPTQSGLTLDEDVVILAPDAPLTDVFFNFQGWSNRNEGARCVKEGGLIERLPIPPSFIRNHTQNSTPNSSAGILMPDGRTLRQNQPFHRCAGYDYATTGFIFQDGDLYGDGLRGAHGGSGMSSIGGTLRRGELVPGGRIDHALKINLFGSQNYYYRADEPDGRPGYRWPAFNADSYAGEAGNPIRYAGTNPALQIGSLLALPAGLNLASLAGNTLGLESEAGLILARAFQDYGAYIVDDTAWSVYGITTEWGPDGRMDEEFAQRWGFPMETPADPAAISDPDHAAWARDVRRIFQGLAVIDNNSPTSVGGGGAPRVPPAQPIRPWRVMPLGDSLTAGAGPDSAEQSYRGALYQLLLAAGYTNVDVVGSQWGRGSAGGDPAHEGHGGYTIGPDTNPIGNLADNIENYLSAGEPDMVLLLIGINDMFRQADGVDPATAPDRLAALVERINELRPDLTIMLASLVPVNWGDDSSWAEYQAINTRAAALAGADPADRIFFVDLYGALDGTMVAADYMADNLHLTASGAAKVAQVWYEAMSQPAVGLRREPPPPPLPQAEAAEVSLPYGEQRLRGAAFGSGAGVEAAFDGDPASAFSAPTADGAYLGLDLGQARQVTAIRYHPDPAHPERMRGGRFQGSNSRDSGYTDLASLGTGSAPAVRWHRIALDNTRAYRYVRFVGADGSFAGVGELEFWSVADTQRLAGTPFGLGPSWGNNPDTTFATVFDGDTASFYDYYTANGGYAGIDLGPGNLAEVTAVRYFPRSGWEARMLNGRFEASTVLTDTGYSLLSQVGSIPELGWSTALISGTTGPARYLRYLAPEGGYGNIAEAEFWTAYPTTKLSGVAFGAAPPPERYRIYLPMVRTGRAGARPGPQRAGPAAGAGAFDGNLTTYATGPVAGIDLGAGKAAAVAVIRYYPRPGREADLVGGRFQGATTLSGSLDDPANPAFTDIYTVPAGVAPGWSSFVTGARSPYRYLRFVGAAGSVAEIELWARAATAPQPAIAVDLSADRSAATTGDRITYRYFIANNGGMPVTVQALDSRLGAVALPDTTLDPGETVVGTSAYTVTVATPLGPLSSTATITATAAGGATAVASDSVAVTIAAGPALAVAKTADRAVAQVGQQITYTYTITNTSGVPVIVTAADDQLGPVALSARSLAADAVATGTLTYTVQADDLPGPLTNTVVVTGSQWSEPAAEPFDAPPSGWSIAAPLEVSGGALRSTSPGAWGGTFAAIKTGATYSDSLALSLDIADFVGESGGNSLRVIFHYQDPDRFYNLSLAGNGEVALRKGWWDLLATSTATYDRAQPATVRIEVIGGAISAWITQAGATQALFTDLVDPTSPLTGGQVGVGTAYNVAAVDNLRVAQLTPRFSVERSLAIPLSALAVSTRADRASAGAGESVTYSYLVTNTGSVALALSARDDRLGAIRLSPGLLPPGATASATATLQIAPGDLPGPLVNSVVVTGTTWAESYTQAFSATPADWSFVVNAGYPGALAVDAATGVLYATQWPGHAAAVYTGASYGDTLRYTVRAIGGGGDVGNAIGLIFHYQNPDDFYMVRLDAGSGAAGGIQIRRGWNTVLATLPATYNIHTWGDLELTVVNGGITLRATRGGVTTTLIDGLAIPGASPLSGGRVGLAAIDNGEARFDDLAVSTGAHPTVAGASHSLPLVGAE